jgi:1,4-dihydroxy-2-naphthoate octaprenyltransferase
MLLPLLFKGVVITAATLLMALVIAAVFILGILVAVVLLSPLWIPFLAGWAAVRFCKKYYKSEAPPKT